MSGWGPCPGLDRGLLVPLSLGGVISQKARLALGLGYPSGNMERIILLLVPASIGILFFEIINGRNPHS